MVSAVGRVPSAFINQTWLPLRNAIWWPSGDETGDVTSIPGSEGRPAVGARTAGGDTTFTMYALRDVAPALLNVAEKTMCVESGSHAGRPRSPLVRLDVAAAPIKLRTRSLRLISYSKRG